MKKADPLDRQHTIYLTGAQERAVAKRMLALRISKVTAYMRLLIDRDIQDGKPITLGR